MSANWCFLLDQTILFLAEVIKFLNPEYMGNYSMWANFKHVFPRMDIFGISKSIFYSFWDKRLKLESYVLGGKTKLLTELIFDLGLVSENIEFWNFKFIIFGRVDFKVDFRGIGIKVHAHNVIVCIFAISKFNNFD